MCTMQEYMEINCCLCSLSPPHESEKDDIHVCFFVLFGVVFSTAIEAGIAMLNEASSASCHAILRALGLFLSLDISFQIP